MGRPTASEGPAAAKLVSFRTTKYSTRLNSVRTEIPPKLRDAGGRADGWAPIFENFTTADLGGGFCRFGRSCFVFSISVFLDRRNKCRKFSYRKKLVARKRTANPTIIIVNTTWVHPKIVCCLRFYFFISIDT